MSTDTITFRDRLSRLTFRRAAKLLGPEGEQLIHAGGRYEFDNLDELVHLGDDHFAVSVGGVQVTITPDLHRPKRLAWACSRCDGVCEHVGAAFSLILEEKTALGLAKAPDLEPVAALSEEEATDRALAERAQRAEDEPMRIRAAEPGVLWTDYAVTNTLTGKTYRVALRSFDRYESYCSCPDFRANTLGTCKHILRVQRSMRKRSTRKQRSTPYRRTGFSVALRYGEPIELRLLPPAELDASTRRALERMHRGPVTDVHALLRLVPKLEARGFAVRIHPDAEAYIERWLYRDRIAQTVAAVRADPARHPLRTGLLNAELLPYQLDGIAFAVGAGRAILADDMGLGKTIQGIGVGEFLARFADIRRVLVVCPASLKGQWQREVERFSGRSAVQVIGAMAERPAQYAGDQFFTIANYEQVLRDHHAIGHLEWDLIILDEGQRIKNWEAKTSQVIKDLRSTFALVLTGTPLENRLDDLYSVAQFIDDRHLGPAFRFFNRHQVTNEKGRVLGYRHMDEIRANLRPFLLRRTRAALLKELPPRSTEVVRVPATCEQLELHDGQKRIVASIIAKPYISEMDLLRLRRALGQCRMVADSTFLCDKIAPGHSSKLEALADLLGNLAQEEGRKIVLFSEWTTMLDLIEPLLGEVGLGHVRLDGSVPQKKRQGLVDRFSKDPDCRVFCCTNAGSTGLNLQAADTVINVDLPWNPAVLEQRIGRAHRMGQTRPVQVYLLISDGTIEETMLQTLATKADMAQAVLDPESDITDVSVNSGIDELKRKMEVLLGRPEAAGEDDAQKRAVAEQLERRRAMEETGGKLVASAFDFLAAALPVRDQADDALSAQIADNLRACTDQGDDGRVRLTIDLGDGGALDRLASSLAAIMAGAPQGQVGSREAVRR